MSYLGVFLSYLKQHDKLSKKKVQNSQPNVFFTKYCIFIQFQKKSSQVYQTQKKNNAFYPVILEYIKF